MIANRLFHIVVLFLSILHNLIGQEYPCNLEYRHMSGKIGHRQAMIDIIISNNEVQGSLFVPGDSMKVGEKDGLRYTERLEGQVDKHGVVTIVSYSQNIIVGKYSGVLRKEFTGTFRADDGQLSETFSFEENYNTSIPFTGYCLRCDSALLDSIETPLAQLEIALLLPPPKKAYEYIRQSIITALLGNKLTNDIADDSLLSYYSRDYFDRYIEGNRDLYDGGLSFNWENIIHSSIGLNHSGLLVYRIDSYGYTGGAHGMGVSRFLVFDSENKKQLDLGDIFIAGYEEELSALLERRYRKAYFIDTDQSLEDAGLWTTKIPPSNNFFLTENSIGFYYNPYKIAPYAMGSQLINLRWDELDYLIKAESPVRGLFE